MILALWAGYCAHLSAVLKRQLCGTALGLKAGAPPGLKLPRRPEKWGIANWGREQGEEEGEKEEMIDLVEKKQSLVKRWSTPVGHRVNPLKPYRWDASSSPQGPWQRT